ncbi:hypothetical protein QMK61_04450 [Fulvimonas sp. R45]|nr:hypothetical protein [Fulvimonas sp. R45]MDO1528077.1 hypothetical protein [Fulvimonas sp. R45]
MSRSQRLIVLAVAILVAVLLGYWFGMERHDAHSLLRALHRVL